MLLHLRTHPSSRVAEKDREIISRATQWLSDMEPSDRNSYLKGFIGALSAIFKAIDPPRSTILDQIPASRVGVRLRGYLQQARRDPVHGVCFQAVRLTRCCHNIWRPGQSCHLQRTLNRPVILLKAPLSYRSVRSQCLFTR